MDYTIVVKKLGNRWYLDVDHENPLDIAFNDKLCRVFNLYDKYNQGQLYIVLVEEYSLIYYNTLFVNDEDVLRYFTTSDDFDMRFIVRDHEFTIPVSMYHIIEMEFNPNFHKTCYRLEIRD